MKPMTAVQLYMSAATAIINKCSTLRNEARANPAYRPDTVELVVRLADRQETYELRKAREEYQRVVETVRCEMLEPFPSNAWHGG